MNSTQKFVIMVVLISVLLVALIYQGEEYLSGFNSSQSAQAIKSEQQNKKEERPTLEPLIKNNPIKDEYTASELRLMYRASRLYRSCDIDLTELKSKSKLLRQRYNNELARVRDKEQWALAMMHMHSLGLVSAQDAVTQIERNEAKQFKTDYEYHRIGTEPSALQNEMMKKIQELSVALQNNELAALPRIIDEFSALSGKRGLSTRLRKELVLLSPDIIIGNTLANASGSQADALLGRVEVTHQMLTQVIRSGGNARLVASLLSRMDFENEPVFNKDGKRETALQAAIDNNSIDVVRLLLAQEGLRYTQFTFSPVNTLLMKVLLSVDDEELNSSQVEMMSLLRDYEHGAQYYQNEELDQIELMGYPLVGVTKALREQIQSLDLKAQIFLKLSSATPKKLDPDLRMLFERNAAELQQVLAEESKKQRECGPLKEAWAQQLPGMNFVKDLTPYLKDGLGFRAQVDNLASVSPTLVDLYYEQSLRSDADTRKIDDLVENIGDIRDDFKALADSLAEIDMDLSQRQYLVNKLCEEYDVDGVYASFSLARYINFNNTDPTTCLFGQAGYFTSIKSDFFAHPDTFPSELAQELHNFSITSANYILSQGKKGLLKFHGYPKGRDALMLALDFKNSSSLSTLYDYDALLEGLLERTRLNSQHLQRLHRLKVIDILLFERLAAKFPEIEDASAQPFNSY
ncbi:hypothetical protein ISG33_10950 [Glaciecola sp. MH2013]|uniref:hypothetical protein n=1 Tax=Glaciecola sp. MH2013 TaxID=2785524 RepID=UPI00189FF1E5|nr:hypothetical protein [Glaciecola sp. MH2013]MBF7073918.1 hypothetical protein [Glaciecola sp. MH2013]